MARGKGHQSIVAFRAGGATWGTAVACGAGHGFYARKFNLSGGPGNIPDEQITGAYVQKIATPGAIDGKAMIECDLTYQGQDRVIANFFGSDTSGVTDTSAYSHVFKFADRDAVFGTMAYEGLKDTKIVEGPSVQFNKLVLSGKQNGVFTLQAEGMADDVKLDSAVNTTTTIDTVTVAAYEKVPFAQAAFLMNDQTAGDLASAPIYVGGVEISLERPIKSNVMTERGNKSSLFIPGGFVKGTLKVDFNILQDGTGGNVQLIIDHLASTAKKARLNITSTNLAGAATVYYKHAIHLPNLRIVPMDIIPVDGPDGITFSMTFDIAQSTAAPTGFTSGYNDGIVWETFNQLATSAIAAT